MAKPRRLLCCALPSVKMPEKLTQLKERLSFKGRRAGRASSSEGQPSFTNLDDEQKHAQQKHGRLGLTARKAAHKRPSRVLMATLSTPAQVPHHPPQARMGGQAVMA